MDYCPQLLIGIRSQCYSVHSEALLVAEGLRKQVVWLGFESPSLGPQFFLRSQETTAISAIAFYSLATVKPVM